MSALILIIVLINMTVVTLQVQEVKTEEGLVLVNFMDQHGPGLFRWDMTRYGTSWEDLDFFSHNSRRVVVDLNEMWSTQRWQLFNVTEC